jgi:DNA-binding GntR family transcriptional regulator
LCGRTNSEATREEAFLLKLVKQHSTKAELVYQTLLDAILNNELAPGARLIVREIADQLSVSDIPVREALKMLEATGLIETKSYAGSVVTIPSPEWVEEVFVMRAALESMAIRSSVPLLQDSDMETLATVNRAMKAAVQQNDTAEYARLNRDFHKALMGKSPYPNLLNMIDDLLVKSQYGRAIFCLQPAAIKFSDVEHDQLLKAVRERDAQKAETIARDHRLRVGKDLATVIRADSLPRASNKDGRQRKDV